MRLDRRHSFPASTRAADEREALDADPSAPGLLVKLIKTGGKVVRQARHVTFQLAELAVLRNIVPRSWRGYDGSLRSNRGQHRYDGCPPLAKPTNTRKPLMLPCLNARRNRPPVFSSLDLSSGIDVIVSPQAEVARVSSDSGGRYTCARVARRRSRARVILEMSASASTSTRSGRCSSSSCVPAER